MKVFLFVLIFCLAKNLDAQRKQAALVIDRPIIALPPAVPAGANDQERVKKEVPSKTIQSSPSTGFLSYNSFTQLSATNDGTSAVGAIDYLLGKGWNFNLNVTTPVTSKTKQVKPLTIGGLTNRSAFTAGLQYIKWGSGFSWDQNSYNNAITAVGGNIRNFNYDNLSAEQQRQFDKLAKINWGTAYYFNVRGGFEQQPFEYVTNPVTISSDKTSKSAFNGTLTGGILTQKGIFALSITHTAGYIADDPVKYYVPISPGSNVLTEKDLNPGAPMYQNSQKLRLEYLSVRYSDSKLRINPNINIQTKQKVFSFEFPVYFLTSDKDRTNFNGGIFAGYVSSKDYKFDADKSNFAFGVFIGANFTKLFQ